MNTTRQWLRDIKLLHCLRKIDAPKPGSSMNRQHSTYKSHLSKETGLPLISENDFSTKSVFNRCRFGLNSTCSVPKRFY